MGYCYNSRTGELCCDVCNESGGVRKMSCPHGYCPSIACCKREACREKIKKHRKEVCSCKCKASSERFHLWEVDSKAKWEAGMFLRTSAVCESGYANCVRVWFKNKSNGEHIRFMAKATYDAIPLGCCVESNAVEEDYAKFGEVCESPKEFVN